ncbi:MAG: uridylate kinase [Betaproteobacteria bacterium HGW-Betaproteobacteria-8]|nr:MAG: uridylate kinase [Betaproteobacteria bacterium HGW-Betaproteobacteria-8]
MWVIKLGGSLLGSQELKDWLDVIAHHGDGRIVIVPGGGILADAVYESQMMSGISDLVAHKMAVMAMDQYGILLAGLNADLVTAASDLEIAERGWQHRAVVWLPSSMVIADESIPTTWEITSDSLAAWLAHKLNADHLILVKSERPQMEQISLERLTKEGFVDEHFGDYIVGQSFGTWVMGKGDFNVFSDGLSEEQLIANGLPVRCSWN